MNGIVCMAMLVLRPSLFLTGQLCVYKVCSSAPRRRPHSLKSGFRGDFTALLMERFRLCLVRGACGGEFAEVIAGLCWRGADAAGIRPAPT